jgi:hypothetical protein
MRRLLFEIVLLLVALGAGGYAGWAWQRLGDVDAQLTKVQAQASSAEQERRALQARMPELLAKESELDAVRRALASGSVLQEYEAVVAGAKAPTAEQFLGLAAIRVLVKGRDNPDTAAAFQKALDLVDWPARLQSLCAAQAGAALGGAAIKMLEECSRLPSGGAVAGAARPAAAKP